MKKILISILFYVSLITCNAQKKIFYGIRSGYGISNISRSNGAYQTLGAYQFGLSSEMKIKGILSLQGEVLFSKIGFKSEDPYIASAFPLFAGIPTFYYNEYYIDVPLQAKIKSSKLTKSTKAYYMLGLSPSFLLSSHGSTNFDNEKSNNFRYQHFMNLNLYNTLGLEFDYGRIIPFIDMRYNHGLTSVNKGGNTTNLQLSFNAGVKF